MLFDPTSYMDTGTKSKKKKKNPMFKIGDKAKPGGFISDLLESNLGETLDNLPLDLVFDDRDMPRAKNWVQFLNGSKFLNIKGFARQNEIGTKLFNEWCPKCTDRKWFMKNGPGYLSVPVDCDYGEFTDRVQLLTWGKCPKCGSTKSEHIRAGRMHIHSQMAGCAGQRSSKSVVTAAIAAYLTHTYLKMQKPTAVLGLLPNTLLHGTFVALTYDQAKNSLWDPFYTTLTEAPWFIEYHKLLDQLQEKQGQVVYKVKDTFVLYRHRNITLYPSGPNRRTLRGVTRFFAAVDEIGLFDHDADSNKIKANALEVMTSLSNSMMTVRPKVEKLIKVHGKNTIPTALLASISSPYTRNDAIMTLHRESLHDNNIFGFKHATWEMNPDLPFDSADLKAERRRRPMEFERDFGANPPLSANTFFSSRQVVEKMFTGRSNKIKVAPKVKIRQDGTKFSYAEIVSMKPNGSPSILALDAGETGNTFSICNLRLNRNDPSKIETSLMCHVVPRPDAPINFSLVYKHLIVPIIKARNVKLLVADRWNSSKFLHDAEEDFEDKGLMGLKYSVKYEDMVNLKEKIYEGMVKAPVPEMNFDSIIDFDSSKYPTLFLHTPVAHFFLQMLTVRDTGDKVLKGDSLNDDMWRAFALGAAFAYDPEFRDVLTTADESIPTAGLGAVATRSGASGAGGSSNVGLIMGRSGGGR